MTLTALIRSLVQYGLAKLVATPPAMVALAWLAETVGWKLDLEAATNWLTPILFGLIVYVGNKLGSRWGWINTLLSLGRATSSPVYVPTGEKEVTATITPPGEQTHVVIADEGGRHLKVAP